MAKLSISDDWWTAPSQDSGGNTVLVTGRRGLDNVIATGRYRYRIEMTWLYEPDGGGKSYEDRNLLTYGFQQGFLVDSTHSTDVNFQLAFSPLTNEEVLVKVLGNDGEYHNKIENVDFTVTRSTGKVTFNSAPGVSPVSGEDNVLITAYHVPTSPMSVSDCITNCTIGALFGINGATEHL